jgi:hypothetical protein
MIKHVLQSFLLFLVQIMHDQTKGVPMHCLI